MPSLTSNKTVIDELTRELGADRVLTAAEDVAVYGYDGTPILRQNPACVVFPKTTVEVAACVKAAARAGVPIVTRGSGTGPD
jgi:glycolate oxidase